MFKNIFCIYYCKRVKWRKLIIYKCILFILLRASEARETYNRQIYFACVCWMSEIYLNSFISTNTHSVSMLLLESMLADQLENRYNALINLKIYNFSYLPRFLEWNQITRRKIVVKLMIQPHQLLYGSYSKHLPPSKVWTPDLPAESSKVLSTLPSRSSPKMSSLEEQPQLEAAGRYIYVQYIYIYI